MEIAYQFRILSEISEHKLKSRTILADQISTLYQIEQCEDDHSAADDVDNFEVDDTNYEYETNRKDGVRERYVALYSKKELS